MKQEEIDVLISNISSKVNSEIEKKGFQTGETARQVAEDVAKSVFSDSVKQIAKDYVSKTDYKDLENQIKSFEKSEEELKSALKKQGEKIADLINSKKDEQGNVDFKAYVVNKLKNDDLGFKQWTKQSNKTNFEIELDVKALCCTLNPSASTTSIDTTVIELPQNKNSILGLVNIVPTDKPNHEYVEEVSTDGNAIFDVCETGLPVPCGAPKPLIDVNYEFNTVKADKYAAGIAICDEMLDDYEFLASELQRVVNRKVQANIEMAILKLAMTKVAAFQMTGVPAVANPNEYDAITAACTQISAMGFEANAVLLNPIDVFRLKSLKDNDGNYLFNIGCDGDNQICCATIIENSCIPVGHFLVGDFSKINIRPYKQFIKYGYNLDDFIKNKLTMLSERRDIIYIANNHTGAFVFDSCENVIAAFATSTPLVPETFKVSTDLSPTANVPYGVVGNQNAPTTYLFVTVDSTGIIKSVATETTTPAIDGAVYAKATELISNNNASGVDTFRLFFGASSVPVPVTGVNISTLNSGWTLLDNQTFTL